MVKKFVIGFLVLVAVFICVGVIQLYRTGLIYTLSSKIRGEQIDSGRIVKTPKFPEAEIYDLRREEEMREEFRRWIEEGKIKIGPKTKIEIPRILKKEAYDKVLKGDFGRMVAELKNSKVVFHLEVREYEVGKNDRRYEAIVEIRGEVIETSNRILALVRESDTLSVYIPENVRIRVPDYDNPEIKDGSLTIKSKEGKFEDIKVGDAVFISAILYQNKPLEIWTVQVMPVNALKTLPPK